MTVWVMVCWTVRWKRRNDVVEITYKVVGTRVLQVLGFFVVLVVGFSVPVEGVRVVLCDHALDFVAVVPHELHGLGAGLEDGHAARRRTSARARRHPCPDRRTC